MAKDKREKPVKGTNPQAANGPYSTGGFVGKGKAHKAEHRAPGIIARMRRKGRGEA